MDRRPKILLADDDPDLLDMYREILAQLPSQPEIHTAASGARAWPCWKPSRSSC